MGTLICYIFPALFFLNVMSDSSERKSTGRVSRRTQDDVICVRLLSSPLVEASIY